jgi:multidrug efflux pump subunit AcrA (membrane-fusion protein)
LVGLANYASVLRNRGDLPAAEAVARDLLARWRRVASEDSMEVAEAHLTLSGVLMSERSITEAEAELRAGLPVLREHFGGDIVPTVQWELQLVQLLRRTRPHDAAAEMRRVLYAMRAALGEDNMHCLKLESYFARLAIEAGDDLEEAERFARHAAQALTTQLTRGDLNQLMAADALHCVIRARGRASEAAPLARAHLQNALALGLVDAQVASPIHQTVGECELDLGDVDAAATELAIAWRIAEEGGAYAADPCHPRRVALMKALARVDDARGHKEDAAAWRSKIADSEKAR